MNPPGFTLDEESRLKALHSIGLLDTGPEECFDRVVRLAAQLFDVPRAALTLIDRERQWFKAQVGFSIDASPRECSICSHVICEPSGELILSDVAQDKRFYDNPNVIGEPHIRSYAGVTITDGNGFRLGALCVLDTTARQFSDKQLQGLRDLAAIVESELLSVVDGLHVNPLERYMEAENTVTKLFQLSEQLVAIFDLQGSLERANPAFSRELGYTPEELRAKDWTDFIHPDEKDWFVGCLRDQLAVGEKPEMSFEGRIRHSSGYYIWSQWRIALREGGDKIYLVGRNFTEEKNRRNDIESANAMLSDVNSSLSLFVEDRRSRNPFNILLESCLRVTNSEFGFLGEVLYDDSGNPLLKTHAVTDIAWNAETRRFYDTYADEGLEFTKLKSLYGAVLTSGKIVVSNNPETDPRSAGLPPGHPPLCAFLGIPVYSGSCMVGMLGLANRAGGYEPCVVESLELLLSTAANLIMAYQAESNARATKQALIDSEAINRATLLAIADGVVTIDSQYIIQTYNRSFQKMFGLKAEAIRGKDLTNIVGSIDDLSLSLSNSDTFHELGPEPIVTSAVDFAGHRLDIELLISPMYLEGKSRWVVVVRDITESARKTAELREATLAANAANNAKTNFLAKMSHEIRTPLNGIIGMAELAMGLAVLEEQKAHIALLIESSRQLAQLLNDVLDYSRMSSGKLTIKPEIFDLRQGFESVLEDAAIRARSKGVDFNINIPPSLPQWVWGDLLRLRQVFVNILDNAIKYTDSGSIRASIRPLESRSKDFVIIRFDVKDTGIGISEEGQSLIFDSFSQVGVVHGGGRYGGVGLGLAICSELLEQMGSRIHVSSEVGVGSSFSYDVGLRVAFWTDSANADAGEASQSVNEVAAAGSADTAEALTILLAEDNLINQKVAIHTLEKCGHTVLLAETGEAAVLLATDNDIDLILMDIGMPGIDGIEATQRIRAAERSVGHKRVPIVALTAHALEGDRQRFLDAGMDGYLPKPYEARDLRAVVAEMAV